VRVSEENKYPVLGLRRDPDSRHHYVKEIRILTPAEYQKLRAVIPMDRHKTLLDILLITGMRYIEVQRLWNNRLWYIEKENIIHLPEEGQKKAKRRQLERAIHPLPSMFSYLMKEFFASRKPPAESVWNRDLRKWAEMAGINPYGISAKTTRKTIESWMIKAGVLESTVCLRQGHTTLVSMQHYQGLAFSDADTRDIIKQLSEWGILRK
jgi:integrase